MRYFFAYHITVPTFFHIQNAGAGSDDIQELAAVLDIGTPGSAQHKANDIQAEVALMTELESLPTEAGLDIDVYYNSVTLGNNNGRANHEAFDWCAPNPL